ncbi:MAG TPA: sigma-70 family RNA polymerase sigma factor [Sandaracinaceae bacterium LLY-WYZ-13_1]|nr:sigma-70 family RNA polymerase sigma factor [Sandaracinaceae bacterium LLY-WYZ-13_1]
MARRASDHPPPPREDPLAALLPGALERDPKALRALVDGVAPDVVRVVRSIVGPDAEDLDDRIQEALMGFIRALPSFRSECGLRRFAKRVAARSAVAARRRMHRKARHHERWVDGERSVPPDHRRASPARLELAERRRAILRALLIELPEAQAQALVLRVVLEHRLGEIAEVTGAPVNTVRSRLRLAKEALRRRLETDDRLRELLEAT